MKNLESFLVNGISYFQYSQQMLAIDNRSKHAINESFNHYHSHHSEPISESGKHSLWNFPNSQDLLLAEHKLIFLPLNQLPLVII